MTSPHGCDLSIIARAPGRVTSDSEGSDGLGPAGPFFYLTVIEPVTRRKRLLSRRLPPCISALEGLRPRRGKMAFRTLAATTIAASVLTIATQGYARAPAPLVPTALVEDVKSATAGVEF